MAGILASPEWLLAVILAACVPSLAILLRRRGDRALADEVRRLGDAVRGLERRLDEFETRTDKAEPGATHTPYDHAVRFAQEGLAAREIAGRCGISQDEAALIVALHGRGQAP